MLLFNYAIVYVTVDSCNYKLEKDDLCVSELFEMLDSVKVEIGILDWGIKMTTLEDDKIRPVGRGGAGGCTCTPLFSA